MGGTIPATPTEGAAHLLNRGAGPALAPTAVVVLSAAGEPAGQSL